MKNFNKNIFPLFVLLILVLALLPITSATSIISTGYRHTYDYYAVTYDGEGDAIVSAKLTIKNTQEIDLTQLALEIPGENIMVYDVMVEHYRKICARYDYIEVCDDYYDTGECKHYTSEKQCTYFTHSGTVYDRVARENLRDERLSDRSILYITLPEAVESDDTITVLISYKLSRQASKSLFGSYNFKFQTLIDNKASMIENIRVAVNVEPDLKLKGTGSQVNYRDNAFEMLGGMQKAVADSSLAEADYQRYASTITTVNGYVKTATFLDPGESFQVNGKYAKSSFGLNYWSWLMTILVLVAIFLIVSALVKKAQRKRKLKIVVESSKPFAAKAHKKEQVKGDFNWKSVIVGGVSAVVMIFSWFLIAFLVEVIDDALHYRFEGIIMPLIIMIAAIWMLFVLIAPALYMGIKYGWKNGLITVASFIGSLIVLGVLIVIILALFRVSYPPPIYF